MFLLNFLTQHWLSYRLRLALGLFLSLLLVFSSVSLLALSGWFIAASAFAGLSATQAAYFNYFLPAAMIRFLALLRIGSRYADRVVNHDITFQILATLRRWFYEKLIPLSPSALITEKSGDLLNRMINDVDTLDHFYLNVLSPFLLSGVLIAATSGFIAFFSKSIALSAAILMIISVASLTLYALKKGMRIGHDIQNSTALLRVKILYALQHWIDLRLFVKKSKRETLIDTAQHNLEKAQYEFSALKGAITAAMLFATGIALVLTLWLGIQQSLNGVLLTMITLLLLGVFEQLLTLPLAALSLGKTLSAAKRIHTITQQIPTIVFTQNESIKNTTLTLENIVFHYPNHSVDVLHDFSLTIPEKTQLVITAPSGHGKSTLLNLIARIYDPIHGNIFIGDTELKNLSEATLRKTICYVTQQIHIFNTSIRDNLTLMDSTISEGTCYAVLEKMCLVDTIYALPEKLNTPMGEFGTQFSGGQIRRIALARALLHDSKILLLDEPSTGLDNKTFDNVWKNCEPVFKEKTLIVATHDNRMIEKIASVLNLQVP